MYYIYISIIIMYYIYIYLFVIIIYYIYIYLFIIIICIVLLQLRIILTNFRYTTYPHYRTEKITLDNSYNKYLTKVL